MFRAAQAKTYPKLESLFVEADPEKVDQALVIGLQARLAEQEKARAEGRFKPRKSKRKKPKE